MLIGILQTGAAPRELQAENGDYPDMFEALLADAGFRFQRYNVEAMAFPASVAAADGWLITGSRHGAYEDHPFIQPLEDFIRAAVRAEIPLAGICFGHQIIAQALGGRVEKYQGGWSVGPTRYQMGDKTLTLNAYHQDQVIALPEGARLTLCNDFCQNAGLAIGERVWTVQAHPEFNNDFTDALLAARGPGVVPSPQLDAAHSALAQAKAHGEQRPTGASYLQDQLITFFKTAHEQRNAIPAQEQTHG